MNRIDQYISAVLSHLPVSEEARSRVAADLRAHLDESVASGLSEEDAISRMGSPTEVDAELVGSLTPAYAPLARRLGAAMLDLTVVWAIGLFLMARFVRFAMANISYGKFSVGLNVPFIGSHWYRTGSTEAVATDGAISIPEFSVLAALVGLSPLLYFVLFEGLAGRTPGKYLFRIRVVRDNAKRAGIFAAVVRRVSILFTPLFVLDALAVFATDKRQRASDMIARTLVLDAAKGPPLFVAWGVLAAAAGIFVYHTSRFFANPTFF
jgi:uncharacterized RDD family membrane protein YckC